ncbi:MAG: alpha/beta hydrolase [Alphaproteobacteria bacterium]|nr:alpha/beta hydrolase [Alphaproteobacteria bacterium]
MISVAQRNLHPAGLAVSVSPAGASLFPGSRVQRIAVPGGDLVVEISGTGPAIILLHGWTLDRWQWQGQAPLADQFTLIAVDRRGFGASTAPPDLAAEPGDISRIAAALGLARYHLVGLSQGGKVALAHAAGAPAGLDRLVVIGAPLDADVVAPPDHLPLAAMTALARAGRLDDLRRFWLAHPLTAGTPDVRSALAAILARYDARDLIRPGRPLRVALADVAGIGVPATALAGAHDTPWRRAVAALLAEAGFGHGLIPGGGHLAPMEAAAATNAALIAALA